MMTKNGSVWPSLIILTALVWTVLSDCPFPKQTRLPNGNFVYQAPGHSNWTNAPENYLLRFRCSEGFTLKGPRGIVCLKYQWTSNVPRCIRMQCNDPPPVSHGHFVLNAGVSDSPIIGSTVTYSCDAGFEWDNASEFVLTCRLFAENNIAQWAGKLSNCTKKESCRDPSVSPDGCRKGNCCFRGNILKFSCNEDYELVGEDEIECLPGGRWSSPRPLCRPTGDHCDLPPRIPHGVAKGEKQGDYYLPYDEVEVVCEPGFRYSGAVEFIMCEEESGWEEDFKDCRESFCAVPESLNNGSIPEIEATNITSFPFNFELTYICEKGFRLIGDSWRYCNTKGWSGKTPYCEEIRCPDPGVPEHGTKLGDDLEIGQKVIFQCFTGYELIGSFERYCMPNGQWNGEVARCDDPSNYCPDPGIPINGVKNSSDYDMGSRIHFRCYSGFTLLGSDIRTCLPNRTWSGQETRCLGSYEFDNGAKVGDILKKAIAEKEAEQKENLKRYHEALFSTTHNETRLRLGRALDLNFPGRLIFYFAFDVSGSVRQNNFRISVDFAKAIIKKVGISKDGARAGALTFSSKAEIKFLPLEYTTTEGVVAALDKLNYTGGGTSASSALKLIREQMIPLTQEVLPKKAQKSIIFILTDGKANMGGDPQDEAEELKEEGAEIYCLGITNNVMEDSLYKIASDPDEEHVFFLKNYAELKYVIDEIINGTIDYSQCGLGLRNLGRQTSRGRIAGGGQAAEPWPWMAALYFVEPDVPPRLKCGGSIIHKNFILTAAHCLYDAETQTLRETKEIIVTLGLTNVRNKTTMEEFEVKTFLFPEQYRYGPIYDYDIALLELKRPIEFTALKRPICLPPLELKKNTNLYKPKQYAVATGWGHSGKVQKKETIDPKSEDALKEVILPIQNATRCKKNAVDHGLTEQYFTVRMFCVGDGNGGNDTCLGDSGGPLMQSQISEEGYTYWTQVGIVSWGIGCGLPNTYGYYTHVQRLLSWVLNTIKSQENNGSTNR